MTELHNNTPTERPLTRSVTLEADKSFNVDIIGRDDSKTAVILVHGFGVKSDSRGLFTAIEGGVVLADSLAICGDYADVQENGVIKVIPLPDQVKRLQAVINYCHQELGPKKLIFVGHSQGCLVIAQAKPIDSQIFLLAPPIDSPYAKFIYSKGWQRPGSHLDLGGTSKLTRSDGSVTIVDSNFWDDLRELNAEDLYRQLTAQNEVSIVLAACDHVLGRQDIPSGMNGFPIEGADHDFKGEARESLLEQLMRRMKLHQ